jgi:hypothetical protein
MANELVNSSFKAYGDIEALTAYCAPIAKSSFSPFAKPEDVAAVALWAHSKKIPLIDALGHVALFNGKLAPDSHLITGILQKAGIAVEVIEDYAPIYTYSGPDGDFTHDVVHKNPDKFDVYYSKDATTNAYKRNKEEKGTKTIVMQGDLVDYRTTLRFIRPGKNGVRTAIGQFSIQDATLAGLMMKDNWAKYPKQCLYARASTIGAKRIADDLIYGAYTPDELGGLDVELNDYQSDEVEYTEIEKD